MFEDLLVNFQASPRALTSFVHDGLLAYKILNYKFKKLCYKKKNFGLAPDPDWIKIQQKSEYRFRDTETLLKIK
jgi:hypothetical protein